MPSAKTHVLVGSVAVAPVVAVPDHRLILPALAGAMVGSLLPDVDSPYSTLGRYALIHPWRHRHEVHSFFVGGCIAVVMVAALLLWAPLYAVVAAPAAFVGYACHLLADRLQGPVPGLWWPFRRSTSRSRGGLARRPRSIPTAGPRPRMRVRRGP